MAEGVAEKALELIEVAKSSGKIKKGSNEVTKALERGIAKLVVIAQDVSPPEIVMHLPLIAKEKGIPCITVPTKEELGIASGMSVGTTAVAVVNEGDGKILLKELKELK